MSHYDTLKCSQEATYEELKKNYQKLAKCTHPDRQNKETDNFIKVNEAWNILRDPHKRKAYDANLAQINANTRVIYAELHLQDLSFDSEGIYQFPCRCGDLYIVDKEHFVQYTEEEVVYECSECSNTILVKSS